MSVTQSDSETHLFLLLLFYTSKMFCIKFELNVMRVVGQISWVTSIENSDMLMLRGVAGQKGNLYSNILGHFDREAALCSSEDISW